MKPQAEAAENQLQSKDQEFQQLHQRHAQIVREYQQLQQHQVGEHQRHSQMVEESRHELALRDRTIEVREKQLRELSQQLESSEQLMAEFQQNLLQRDKVVRDLQESLTTKDRRIQQLEQQEASGRVASGASTQPTEKEDGGKGGEGDQPTGGVRSIHLRWRKSTREDVARSSRGGWEGGVFQ